MQSPDLVFCERSGRWATAWRTASARAEPEGRRCTVRLAETRSIAECRETLACAPSAFVAIELAAARADAALGLLAEITTSFRAAAAAVLADYELVEYEPLARELGAVHFIASPRRMHTLVGVVRRHVARQPPVEMTLREAIWSRLPW